MNDGTYELICQKVRDEGGKMYPNRDLTAWIRAIQQARIVQLGSWDAWTDDQALIQVRSFNSS